MSKLLKTYVNDQLSVDPFENAYAWIGELQLRFWDAVPDGQVVLAVNIDAKSAAAGKGPIGVHTLRLGTDLPSFMELMADPDFSQAFAVIRQKLYAAVASHQKFSDSEDVD